MMVVIIMMRLLHLMPMLFKFLLPSKLIIYNKRYHNYKLLTHSRRQFKTRNGPLGIQLKLPLPLACSKSLLNLIVTLHLLLVFVVLLQNGGQQNCVSAALPQDDSSTM